MSLSFNFFSLDYNFEKARECPILKKTAKVGRYELYSVKLSGRAAGRVWGKNVKGIPHIFPEEEEPPPMNHSVFYFLRCRGDKPYHEMIYLLTALERE